MTVKLTTLTLRQTQLSLSTNSLEQQQRNKMVKKGRLLRIRNIVIKDSEGWFRRKLLSADTEWAKPYKREYARKLIPNAMIGLKYLRIKQLLAKERPDLKDPIDLIHAILTADTYATSQNDKPSGHIHPSELETQHYSNKDNQEIYQEQQQYYYY